MRILIVTTYGFDPAFPSRPEQLQARALAARGHAVVAHEYLDPRYPGQSHRHEWLPGNVPVHRAATLGFFAPEALLRLLGADRPEVIHLHHLRNLLGFQTVLAARRLGIPTVLTVHGLLHDGDLVADRERPLEAPLRYRNVLTTPGRLAARLARGAHPRRAARNYLIHAPLLWVDHVVALSRAERNLLARLGLDPLRVSVLPNAVDLRVYEDEPPPVGARPPLVLFIGQLVPRKGFDLLARAMPLVVRAVPEARFVFVSHNRDGELELRRIAAEGGVADRLAIMGPVSEAEKIGLLHEAAVMAAPSRYEGFGIPLIEALAAGAPVVTTDVVAGNEIIAHERTGLLVPYGDVEGLAAAIIRLLSDRTLGACLAAAGRPEAFARYSAETLAVHLEALYDRLIARRELRQVAEEW
ncbi:MAG: glycosyltransferase family 4 protein [Oscillochloridaceae bacterium]|nr:glycosyltransferase family 4 protein [Chloroflexaceae bacterium]MDW8390424.1 glycosyltransferase family 4 protein [Oscillochloridaceae bacterium]